MGNCVYIGDNQRKREKEKQKNSKTGKLKQKKQKKQKTEEQINVKKKKGNFGMNNNIKTKIIVNLSSIREMQARDIVGEKREDTINLSSTIDTKKSKERKLMGKQRRKERIQ